MAADGLCIEREASRLMDALSAIFDVLLALLGIYQEHQVTREQCERMWAEGYVIYPLSAEEIERAQKCRDLQDGIARN